jgi:hypothetical protein
MIKCKGLKRKSSCISRNSGEGDDDKQELLKVLGDTAVSRAMCVVVASVTSSANLFSVVTEERRKK